MSQVIFKKVINNEYMRRLQRTHALTVNWFSFLGLLLALALIVAGYPFGLREIGIFVVMWFFTAVGITVGFHRHFTHRSFKASAPIRAILAILGCMASQGTLFFWVSLHRLHHEHSDKPGDPHSPHVRGDEPLGKFQGLWHSYIGWTTNHEVPNPNHYARDLIRDNLISRINRLYFLWVLIGLAIPTILGGILGGTWFAAFLGFLWGGPVRMYMGHNLVWSITSIAHIAGDHDMDSDDHSTNNIWLALPTLGESWHNNHHAFPNSAISGFRWWQIDISAWVIRILEIIGLAWDVNKPSSDRMKEKQIV